MTRYSAVVLTLLCVCAGGCASRGSVAGLGERMVFLEREVLAVRTEEMSLKDETHELDLRVEHLERQALKRGETVAPRRVETPSPAPAEPAGPARTDPASSTPVLRAEPAKTPDAPATTSPLSSARPASPSRAALSKTSAPSTPGSLPAPAATTPGESPTEASTEASTQDISSQDPFFPDTPATAPAALPPAALPRLTESTPSTPAPPAAPSRAPAQPEQKAYDAALQLYRTGRYAESEAAFQAFLDVYPNSRLVPNALYWQGETLYSRGRYTDAIFAFKDVQTRFPRDPKTPDSLLKTAMAYQKMGDAANASLHLTVLYEDWPGAEASQRARRLGLKP